MPELNPSLLLERLDSQLSPQAHHALEVCRKVCARQELGLFLVGGAVRDLVLDRPTVDLDLAIEGEVALVAQSIASLTGGRPVLHSRFGTATVKGHGFNIDLARTRREIYTRPGALPEVTPAPLLDDLARRDFTVNAMALRFDPPELIDPFNGVRDAQLQLIRVLHRDSFRDDATRSLRAIRYAARLSFALEVDTASWLRRDVDYVEPISGPRLRRELAMLFNEPEAAYGTIMGQRLGLLEAVHPSLHLENDVALRWRDALDMGHFAETDEMGFCILIGEADESHTLSVSRRLHLQGRYEAAMLDTVRLRPLWAKLATLRDDPPEAVETLERFHDSAIWATAILADGDAGLTCNRYLEYWRQIRPQLKGEDLMSLGVQTGVAVGDMLRALKRARLAGQAPDRDTEIALVHEMLGR